MSLKCAVVWSASSVQGIHQCTFVPTYKPPVYLCHLCHLVYHVRFHRPTDWTTGFMLLLLNALTYDLNAHPPRQCLNAVQYAYVLRCAVCSLSSAVLATWQ